MQTPITPQIHKLRPSGSRKNPHLNPILEESYGTRGKSSSSQEHDYNMKGSDSIKVKNDPSPFKNITNDPAKIVFVNNHKFITGKSKSPLKPEENVSKVILNKTIKPNEIVSERQMNLMKKIKVLQKRISQLHMQKQQYKERVDEEIQKLKNQNQKLKRASVQTERKMESSRNYSTPIKQMHRFDDQEHEKRIYTLKKVVDNLQSSLKQSLSKNQELKKENKSLKEHSVIYERSSEFEGSGDAFSNKEQKIIFNNIDISQIKINSQNLQEKIKVLEEKLDNKDKEIANYKQTNKDKEQAMMKEFQTQKEQLKLNVQEKEKAIRELKQQLGDKEQRIRQCEGRIQQLLKEPATQEQKQLQKSLQNIAQKIQYLSLKNDKLQEENSKANQDIQQINKQFREINDTNQELKEGIKNKNQQINRLHEQIKEISSSKDKCTKCKNLVQAIYKLNNKIQTTQ